MDAAAPIATLGLLLASSLPAPWGLDWPEHHRRVWTPAGWTEGWPGGSGSDRAGTLAVGRNAKVTSFIQAAGRTLTERGQPELEAGLPGTVEINGGGGVNVYFGWGLELLGAYVLLVVLARWIYIARTNVVWTSAQAEAMTKRLFLQVERDPSSNGEAPLTQATLKQLVDEIKKESPQRGHTGVVGWNGSHQIAQWVLMHEAERLMLPTLGHEELVARLERALDQLDELPQRRREAWEDVIHTLLATKHAEDERLNRVYRAYLDELLGEIYEASNGKATQLSGLYNRATWVILVALLPLEVLAGLGYGVLLVAGAIGGLVSRMQRLVFSKRIPITYGSSWAPLFCAPILGALAAWAGLVLISLLQTTGVLELTALETSLEDLRTPSSALLGLAILLGTSERFLLQLEKQAESVIGGGSSDQHAPANTPAASQRVRLLASQTSLSPTAATHAVGVEEEPRSRSPQASLPGQLVPGEG